MTASQTRLRIGFIPLADAAALIVAVDKGFAAAEGLDVELVREVSWSNVRDKLNIGLFDAAHLLAPVAIASSLGLGHVKVPIVAPFGLGVNGNAITVSPALYAAIAAAADGNIVDPMVSARALARVVAERKARGEEPLTFGMTFPFSTHNYHLRFWMAAGGVDPDEDVRLVVLPPPYMVESLANGHVDGFCVGAPWNSVAVDLGVGFILHFVSEILLRAAEKVLAVRARWAQEHPDTLLRLVRAHGRAAAFIEDEANRDEVAAFWRRPNRIGVAAGGDPPHARRPHEDRARRHHARERPLSPDRPQRRRASRPGAGGLALCADGALGAGAAVGRTAGRREGGVPSRPLRRGDRGAQPRGSRASRADGIGAFAGPPFDPSDIARISTAGRSGGRDRALRDLCAAQNVRMRWPAIAGNQVCRRSRDDRFWAWLS